jgi:hypothetical protein
VGLEEGAIDLDHGLHDLADVGSSAGASVGRALATVAGGRSGVVVGPALTTGPAGPEPDDGLIRL